MALKFAGTGQQKLLGEVMSIISTIMWVILALVGAIGAVYAIYLGIKLARAEDQGKRDDCKKHLITVFIAIGVTVALILVFNTFLPAIISAFAVDPKGDSGVETPPAGGMLEPMLHLLNLK